MKSAFQIFNNGNTTKGTKTTPSQRAQTAAPTGRHATISPSTPTPSAARPRQSSAAPAVPHEQLIPGLKEAIHDGDFSLIRKNKYVSFYQFMIIIEVF